MTYLQSLLITSKIIGLITLIVIPYIFILSKLYDSDETWEYILYGGLMLVWLTLSISLILFLTS